MLRRFMLELTSPFLPPVLGFIFAAAIVWGIFNVELPCEHADWIQELTRCDVRDIKYQHAFVSSSLSVLPAHWHVYTDCIQLNGIWTYLFGLATLSLCGSVVCLLLWYGEMVAHTANVVFLTAKREPPNPVLPPILAFSKTTTKISRMMSS